MHWLTTAANRAGLPAAADLKIGRAVSTATAWDAASRGLGLTVSELAIRLAPGLGVRVANIDGAESRALTLLPEKLARRFQVYPLREDDRTITVATADPMDLNVEQAISFASGRRTVFELAPPHAIGEAINAGYSQENAIEKLLFGVDAQIADAVRVVGTDVPEVVTEAEIGSGPVVKLTNLIIRDAVVMGASDIHIEPGPKGGAVRYRIDGVMRVHLQLPMAALVRVVSRIKVISQLNITERLRPQDGRARVNVDGKDYDMRVSTVPTRSAEKVVIRILRSDTAKTLETAGLPQRELAAMRQLLGFREGIVIVTGPTGSGKTTTLYAALKEVVERGVNITTVEDPIEYELGGITQIQVDPKRGVTFASALKAILRQDPDVIFVGEIRDLETAEVAVQAALTGHLVLATMHTNDALGAVARLNDLGVDRASIASSLRGSIAQRLLRRVCGECGRPVEAPLTDEERRLATAFGVQPVIRATGCAACGNTGYRGRIPIIEVAVMTPAIVDVINNNGSAADLRRTAAAAGMRALREVAIECVGAGHTTLQEVERVVGDASDESAKSEIPPAATPAEPPRPSVATNGSGPTILFVDDDPVIRLLAAKLLREAGYQVDLANDGKEALDRVRNGDAVNLVITDLHMPRFGGAELLAELRESGESAGIPVIVLTGSDENDQESSLMNAGADDYIRKPIDPARFISRIRAALRRANL
jgi:type II secretory ATPase GspE/PulE/Tfp pilus assembly ATPase PilB-like protein/ActR/RegA family two-component response regulator